LLRINFLLLTFSQITYTSCEVLFVRLMYEKLRFKVKDSKKSIRLNFEKPC